MKRKCDKCNRPATHHEVIIVKGQKIEKNFCDVHAAEEGLSVKNAHAPINELLSKFVNLSAAGMTEQQARQADDAGRKACDTCGLTFAQFREHSLLGCPRCYGCFEQVLAPLIERHHEGGTHHVGKVPRRAGVAEQRQAAIQRLRRRLDDAVDAEDYELAADLRDQLKTMESAGL